MPSRAVHQYQRRRAVRCGLHLGEIKTRVDNGLHRSNYYRHVIGQATRHDCSDCDFLDSGHPVTGPHRTEHHVAFDPRRQHHPRYPLGSGDDDGQAIGATVAM